MTILTQAARAAEFVVSVDDHLSTDTVTLAAGPALPAGQLLAYDPTAKHFLPYPVAPVEGHDPLPAAAVLWAPQPERSVDAPVTAVTRLAAVHGELLTGLDAAAQAALMAHLIIVR